MMWQSAFMAIIIPMLQAIALVRGGRRYHKTMKSLIRLKSSCRTLRTTAGQSFTSNLNFYPGGVGDAYGAIALLAPGTEQQPSTFSTSTGAQEGDLLNVTVQGFTSAILGLSSIDVTQSATAGEGFCDNALTTLLTQQDMLGSAISAAADYAQNNELTSTNLIAAASSIQDLNVAQASTQYDKEEMLAAFTTTLISQSSNLQKSLLQLFR